MVLFARRTAVQRLRHDGREAVFPNADFRLYPYRVGQPVETTTGQESGLPPSDLDALPAMPFVVLSKLWKAWSAADRSWKEVTADTSSSKGKPSTSKPLMARRTAVIVPVSEEESGEQTHELSSGDSILHTGVLDGVEGDEEDPSHNHSRKDSRPWRRLFDRGLDLPQSCVICIEQYVEHSNDALRGGF